MPYLSPIQDLSPSVHPLVQARQLGITLLMHAEVDTPKEERERVRELACRGCVRTCRFGLSGATKAVTSPSTTDWAALAKTWKSSKRAKEHRAIPVHPGPVLRDERIDSVVDLRMMWNTMLLGDFAARRLFNALEWTHSTPWKHAP